MNLIDIVESDVQDVLFADIGKQVSYKRKNNTYTVNAVVLENNQDREEEFSVEGKAYIYVSVKELEDKDIGLPLPHDIIDNWEVEKREKIGSLWRLTCYNAVRPKP